MTGEDPGSNPPRHLAGAWAFWDGGTAMTLGKKLYISFGCVLLSVVFLFLVNWRAVSREHDAKKAAAASLELADATDAVKFQMMQNRLYMSNYLLSGDTREVERMNDGLRLLNERLEKTQNLANSDQQKNALERLQQMEQSWAKEFAEPLVEKRKDVDSGNATVAELQIFYLQKDASSWVKNATEFLDVADRENKKVLEERRKSDRPGSDRGIVHRLPYRPIDHRTACQADVSSAQDRQHRRFGPQH